MFDAKANAAYLLGRGRCPQCSGARPVLPGKKRCAKCTERNRIYNLNRIRRFKAEGKCGLCGAELPEGWGRKRCPACTEIQRSAQERYRDGKRRNDAELMARGLCVDCGTAPAEPGQRRCASCTKKRTESGSYVHHLEWMRRKVDERRANGLCTVCGKPVEPGRRKCRKCLDSAAAYARKYRTEMMAWEL